MPKVSVIVCTHNREKLLPRALNSILGQDFKDLELIVIDDASNDGTKSLIDSYIQKDERVKYYKNEFNLGIAKSRNRGCEIANGTYIAMLDSDDWWLKTDKLSKQVALLDAHPDTGIVGTSIVMYDKNDNFIKEDIFETEDGKIRFKILCQSQFCQSSTLFRKDAFIATGKYDETMVVCDDLALWLQIGLRYKFANIKEADTAYFVNPEGISKLQKRRMSKERNFLVEKYKMNYPGYPRAKAKSLFNSLMSSFRKE